MFNTIVVDVDGREGGRRRALADREEEGADADRVGFDGRAESRQALILATELAAAAAPR
jgi:hypothetical protein